MAWTTKDLIPAGDASAQFRGRPADSQGYLTAIVQVREPHYVPDAVHVRTRVSPTAFEGVMRTSALETVRADVKVKTVSGVRRQELGY